MSAAAKSWSLESVFDESVDCLGETVEIGVSAEVPEDAERNRLQRYGNRYCPTFVDLEIRNEKVSMPVAAARTLAAALLRAAGAADAIDVPDSEPTCGHWAPCDYCKQPAPTEPR